MNLKTNPYQNGPLILLLLLLDQMLTERTLYRVASIVCLFTFLPILTIPRLSREFYGAKASVFYSTRSSLNIKMTWTNERKIHQANHKNSHIRFLQN